MQKDGQNKFRIHNLKAIFTKKICTQRYFNLHQMSDQNMKRNKAQNYNVNKAK